jgi:hypothetical protein
MTTFQQVDVLHERSLTSQLKTYASDKALNGPQRASRSIHGSGFYHCSRQQVYGLLGYEQTDKKYVWAWDLAARMGDQVHNLIQTEFCDSGKVVILPNGKPAIEVSLDSQTLPEAVYTEYASYKLGIRIDAVLEGLDGRHILLEIKSVDQKYLTGPERKYLPGKLADFEAQTQLSLHFWRNPKTGERSQYGLIYIVSRSDVTVREEWLVEYDPLFVEPELKRIANIRDHWIQAKLPEPEPSRGPCAFCGWRSICVAPESQKK